MSSERSATSAAYQMPRHAGPSPKAAGASFHVGGGSPGQSALPPPKGSLAHTSHSSHRASLPRVCFATLEPLYYRPCRITVESGTLTPGQPHPVEMAGNSPVYSHGCKFIPPVADGAAGKPSFNASGRKTYFRYSSQGCIRARLHPGPHQPAIRRMDRGLRPGAPHRALELICNGVVDTSGGRR